MRFRIQLCVRLATRQQKPSLSVCTLAMLLVGLFVLFLRGRYGQTSLCGMASHIPGLDQAARNLTRAAGHGAVAAGLT